MSRSVWRGLFAAYALGIAVATHWPALTLPKGPVPRPDLFVHISVFALWTILLGLTGWLRRAGAMGTIRHAIACGVVAALYACIDEATQAIPVLKRTAVIDDLVANLLGVAAGAVVLVVFPRVRGFVAAPDHQTMRLTSDESQPATADAIDDDVRVAGHARTFAGFTLLSRVLGMGRDALCARVFGASPIWSAFVTAFVVPNLLRRLFGEGALTASFIPEYERVRTGDGALAARFAALTASLVAAGLGVLAGVGVAGCIIALGVLPEDHPARTVLGFLAVMLPFMPAVCVTAVLGGTLQVHGRFAPHAAAPVILNLCMIACVSLGAFVLGGGSRMAAAWGAAIGVCVAGFVQLAWCLWSLRGVIDWRRGFAGAAAPLRSMGTRFFPALIGMGTLQIGVMIDGLIAGYPVTFGPTVFGHEYPLDGRSASVLYFASRLYQFPLGVFGLAVATAAFPALARAAGDPGRFAETLRRGVRLSLFVGLPASVGLALIAPSAIGVIYVGGEFGQADLDRTAGVLVLYASAVWAYALTHVFTRAFYAAGNTRLPTIVGSSAVALNITMSLGLMWPLGERGLALATAVSAIGQALVLAVLLRKALPSHVLFSAADRRSIGWMVVMALLVAAAVGGALLTALPIPPATDPFWARLGTLAAQVLIGAGVYGAAAVYLRRPELGWWLSRAR